MSQYIRDTLQRIESCANALDCLEHSRLADHLQLKAARVALIDAIRHSVEDAVEEIDLAPGEAHCG